MKNRFIGEKPSSLAQAKLVHGNSRKGRRRVRMDLPNPGELPRRIRGSPEGLGVTGGHAHHPRTWSKLDPCPGGEETCVLLFLRGHGMTNRRSVRKDEGAKKRKIRSEEHRKSWTGDLKSRRKERLPGKGASLGVRREGEEEVRTGTGVVRTCHSGQSARLG